MTVKLPLVMSKISESQEPQPPILKRNGFQFRNGVFDVGGIGRVDGSRLHELFNPSTVRLKRDQKAAAEEARRLLRKPFIVAQLKYYDIPFRSSSGKAELQLLLQDAVRQGKCDHMPQLVTELEASMRADYEPLQQQWEADCTAWRAEMKRRDDETFEKCKTPSERAAFDLQRFLDMYFLTDGEPDEAKTTKVLALSGLRHRWKLHSIAMKVPGLHTRGGGYSEEDREICIGWDLEEVSRMAKSITDRADEANKAQYEALWEEQLEKHRKFVAQVPSEGTSNGVNRDPEPFSLDRCKGSYVIRCHKITDGWSNILQGHTHTMDISSGHGNTLRAAYHFGILEGTMILSLSEETLQAIVPEDSLDSEASDEDEEEAEEDDAELQDSTSGMKRKRGNDSPAGSDADPHGNEKRRKTDPLPSPSRRVYFRLHGRETGEGEVLHWPDSGHIDFLGDDCASFAGLVYDLTHVGSNVEFQGFKVSDKPRVKPEPWETFLYGRYGL